MTCSTPKASTALTMHLKSVPSIIIMLHRITATTSQKKNQNDLPDKDDCDFGWRALNDGRCILVTVAMQDLSINLQ